MLASSSRQLARKLAPGARVLYQAEQLRLFADAPAPPTADHEEEDEDIVLSSFKEMMQQYMALMKGLQNINIPLTGDDAAVKKYAQEVEALKRKIGMPDVEEVIDAELNYKFACSGYDVRKFVATALEDVEGMDELVNDVLAAVDAAEKQSGRELDGDNHQGWELLTSRVGEIKAKYGLADKAKVREDAIFDMYKSHVQRLRTAVETDINKAKTNYGLEWCDVDLAQLKPKLG